MYRLVWAIPMWIGFLALRTTLILLGWLLVPVAVLCGAHEKTFDSNKERKGEDPDVYHFTWRLMWLWDNWEDGIANTTYWTAPNFLIQTLYWSCLRNPVNNMRRVPLFTVRIDPARVEWVGTRKPPEHFDRKPPEVEWFFCWHGIHSNLWVQFPMFGSVWRAWLGWKIFPYDINGVTGHRVPGAGFATQFKRLR